MAEALWHAHRVPRTVSLEASRGSGSEERP